MVRRIFETSNYGSNKEDKDKRRRGRPTKAEQKVQAKIEDRAGRYKAQTKFFCPHCQKTFDDREMWLALARHYGNLWEIMEVLSCSMYRLMHPIDRYKLQFRIKGCEAFNKWESLALKLNYYTPEEMFWDLKIKKQWSYQRITDLFGMQDHKEEVIAACRSFIDPHLRKGTRPEFPIKRPKPKRKRKF
jgi:hypothetical protein